MMSHHKAISKADMVAAFPASTTNINRTLSFHEFIRVIFHLIQCSQIHASVLSNLGLLFVCIPDILWGNYSGDAYPPDPIDPDIIPLREPGQDDVTWENYRIQWHYMKMLFQDFKTMNAALVYHVLALMGETYTKDFTKMRITNLDMQFWECLAYFVDKYGETNESERATNKTRMKTSWSLQDGYEKL